MTQPSKILSDAPSQQNTPHPCKQEARIKNLEERQAQDMKNISKKLNLIWTAINTGDKDNMKNLITVVGIFVGALVTVTLGFVAIIKLL